MPYYQTRDGGKVFVPEPGNNRGNPSGEIDPIEEARKMKKQLIADAMVESELAKAEAERAKAEAEASKAKAEVEKREQPPETPLKIKGELNFGVIDWQKQQEEAKTEAKRLKDEIQEQARAQGQANEQLREELHKKELDILQLGLQNQIQKSNERLEQLIQQLGNRKNFLEEYNDAMGIAKQLGFYNPQAGTDATVQIELKKMDFEHNMELRKMAREEKRADRQFQLEMRKYDDDRAFKQQELEQRKKRDEMLASAPERIGRVIAKGFIESGGAESSISEEMRPTPRGRQPSIEAGVGEAGETDCPQCQQPIAIGPTARQAVCPNCGIRYPIKRVAREASTLTEGE